LLVTVLPSLSLVVTVPLCVARITTAPRSATAPRASVPVTCTRGAATPNRPGCSLSAISYALSRDSRTRTVTRSPLAVYSAIGVIFPDHAFSK